MIFSCIVCNCIMFNGRYFVIVKVFVGWVVYIYYILYIVYDLG